MHVTCPNAVRAPGPIRTADLWFRNTPNPVHQVQHVHYVFGFVHYVHWVRLRPLRTRDETRDGAGALHQ